MVTVSTVKLSSLGCVGCANVPAACLHTSPGVKSDTLMNSFGLSELTQVTV